MSDEVWTKSGEWAFYKQYDMENVLKNMVVSFKTLEKVLKLPDGVIIAAVRQGHVNGVAEFTVADLSGALDGELVFDEEAGRWVPCQQKGRTRGEESGEEV